MFQQEGDRRIKSIWERHCDMEIGQLQVACDVLRRYEGVDPYEILPKELPETPVTFEPNKDYVREVLASQIDLRKDGVHYVTLDQLPRDHRYFGYQRALDTDAAPSELAIVETRNTRGNEYRDQTEGQHPIPDLAVPATA
jgi:hypothetical protein